MSKLSINLIENEVKRSITIIARFCGVSDTLVIETIKKLINK
jgi:DNA-binding Lrp family transcriptional regulator